MRTRALSLCCGVVYSLVVGIAAAEPAPKAATTRPADSMVMEQRVTMEMPGMTMPPQQMLFKFKGARMRMDSGNMMSVITYEDGHSATLMHMNHMVMTTTTSQLKEGVERAATAPGNPETAPVATATGQKQKINGYDAEAYTFDRTSKGQTSKVTVWITPDYPDAEPIIALQESFQVNNKSTKLTGSMMPGLHPTGLPKGMTIRSESVAPNGAKVIVEVVTAKLVPVDESEFEVPKDYQQSAAPMGPAGR